jgi:hypothetical protein
VCASVPFESADYKAAMKRKVFAKESLKDTW